MKMTWWKIKLGDVLIKKNLRLKDMPNLTNPVVLGVTNKEGVVKSKVAAGQKIDDYFVVEKGDFVYNPYRINVGSIGISELEGITSLAYVVFNVDESRLNKYLLFKLLKSEFGINEIIKNGRGSVRNALRYDDLAKIELTLPTIDEQNKFADNFKVEEKKINRLKLFYPFQLAQLDKLNQAILQEAVQGKLVGQIKNDDFAGELLKRIKAEKATLRQTQGKKEKTLPSIKPEEIPFEIPESWVWCRLGDLGNFRRGPFGSALTKGIFVKEGYKVYEQRNAIYDNHTLGNYFVTEKKFQELKAFQVSPKDLIVSCSGATLGKIAEIPDGAKEGIINQALMRIILFHSVIVNSFFIKLFRSPYFQKCMWGQAWGTAIPNMVGLVEIKKILIPLPPLPEQKRIVAEIEKQLAKTKQLKEHITANQQATEQLLKALLHGAFEVERE